MAVTTRSDEVSKRTQPPLAPLPDDVRLPPVNVVPDQVPNDANGRLNFAEKYTVCAGADAQNPAVVTDPSTVSLLTIEIDEDCAPVPLPRACAVLNSTFAWVLDGNVYRCQPLRNVAVSSVVTPLGVASR